MIAISVRTILFLAMLILFLAPAPSIAGELAVSHPSLLPLALPASPHALAPAAPVASWTHQGCWTPRSGSPCVDVYRDGSGQLWLCKACGTTGNPSPGKCSKTTQAQLDRGLWCS